MVTPLLDLFSGCGGLSLGAKWAGFQTALAIDKDPILSGSFGLNFSGTLKVVANIKSLNRHSLSSLIPHPIAGILGGPPCQAFSSIGRADPTDPRRTLVSHFFRVVADVQPAFFMFENVRGLGFQKNISVLERGLDRLGENWQIVGPVVLDAQEFGAPTRRKRLFVFGFNRDLMTPLTKEIMTRSVMRRHTVRDAIGDLAGATKISAIEGKFDSWKYSESQRISDYAAFMRSADGRFSGNQRTIHTDKTIRRFSKIEQGGVDPIGKYKRLSWDGVCPTLRAGTGNDKGSYQAVRPLHPTQNRVITVREAARLQGFPDWFRFHPTIWHSFRMIGNSVSPIIAAALLQRIYDRLALDQNRELPIAAE